MTSHIICLRISTAGRVDMLLRIICFWCGCLLPPRTESRVCYGQHFDIHCCLQEYEWRILVGYSSQKCCKESDTAGLTSLSLSLVFSMGLRLRGSTYNDQHAVLGQINNLKECQTSSETFIFSHFWTQSQGGRAEDSFLVVTSCVAPSSNTKAQSPLSSSAPSIFFFTCARLFIATFFGISLKLSLRNLLKRLWCSHTMEYES